jgi:endonuclease III
MQKGQKIVSILKKEYPKVRIALRSTDSLQLLIAVMLSAQCTDKQVNIVTKKLFKKYKKVEDYADADLRELQKDVKSTGFFRQKAKNIKNTCKILIKNHKGKVPDTMEELTELPGVARKTANIVLSNAFGKNEGIAVDTHVKRLSYRIGLTKNTNPDKIEHDLVKFFPKKQWNTVTYILIEHGRALCKAPVPICSQCPVNKMCPKNGATKYK